MNQTKTVSKRLKAALCRKTAKAFESNDFQWVRHDLGDTFGDGTNVNSLNTEHCALGGLIHEAIKAGLTKFGTRYALIGPFRDIGVEYKVSSKLGAGTQNVDVVVFNDVWAKSKADVVKHLRMTARAFEHGGKV